MRTPLPAALVCALLLAGCHKPSRPRPPRILFVGNSITAYGPQPDIGWHGSWGMAASAAEKDYAHLVAAAVGTDTFYAMNTGWEFSYATGFDYTVLSSWDQAEPDLMIVKLGENAAWSSSFKSEFARLIASLRPKRVAVVSVWWSGGTSIPVDADMKAVADENGYAWVQLPDHDSSYNATAFQDAAVALHPGDKGMQLIADSIVAELRSRGWSE